MGSDWRWIATVLIALIANEANSHSAARSSPPLSSGLSDLDLPITSHTLSTLARAFIPRRKDTGKMSYLRPVPDPNDLDVRVLFCIVTWR